MVRVENSLFKDMEQLTAFLESLYLKGGEFNLHVPREFVCQLELSFDQIIQKHGIRPANFTYIFDGSEFK
jgi:hypothetical protein